MSTDVASGHYSERCVRVRSPSGCHVSIQALPPAIAPDLWSLIDHAGCGRSLMAFEESFGRSTTTILRNEGMRRFFTTDSG